MQQFTLKPIGKIEMGEEEMFIHVDPQWRPALQALDSFSHACIFWWFDRCDDERCRQVLRVPSPYKNAPEVMGTFATRSPERPNPIAMSVVRLLDVDLESGRVRIDYIDAHDGSPVLDLKPYTPSLDRVEAPGVPGWCGHWPKSVETSGDFDWESVFNF